MNFHDAREQLNLFELNANGSYNGVLTINMNIILDVVHCLEPLFKHWTTNRKELCLPVPTE
jgi:hypothetical protein